MSKQEKQGTDGAWPRFAETLFEELFEDYSHTAEAWADFEAYIREGTHRTRPILTRHHRRLLTLILQEHARQVKA